MTRKHFSFTFIGVLISLIIIAVLSIILIKEFLKSSSFDEKMGKIEDEKGKTIDTKNPKSIIDTTKNKVDEINKKNLERSKQLEGF